MRGPGARARFIALPAMLEIARPPLPKDWSREPSRAKRARPRSPLTLIGKAILPPASEIALGAEACTCVVTVPRWPNDRSRRPFARYLEKAMAPLRRPYVRILRLPA